MDTRTVRDQSADDARHEVLTDSNAQTVRNYLKRLFQEKARFRGRWIWELLQNARDASSSNGVRLWLTLEPDRIVFKHDGLPFNYKNIAHLIYQGTGKYEPSISGVDSIGQYGTGFLATHLISKTVWVSGILDDKKQFNFLLDRRSDSADDLKMAMDDSWNRFVASCSETPCAMIIRTEYEYPLAAGLFDSVNKDISDLIENAASDDKKVWHVTKGPVEVSALAYFESGAGLDAVRRSKSRAMEPLLFLANYGLEAESGALEPAMGECECGTGGFYPTRSQERASRSVP